MRIPQFQWPLHYEVKSFPVYLGRGLNTLRTTAAKAEKEEEDEAQRDDSAVCGG